MLVNNTRLPVLSVRELQGVRRVGGAEAGF